MTIDIQDLTVRYGKFTAVDQVTVTFVEGAVGLLGRNGAGKSTILKTVLGFLKGATGAITVLGIDARRDPNEVRRRIGYMPEKESYFPLLTGFEMVALAAELSGLPRRQARQRAHESLFYVGLGEQRYRPVATYSTGMKQKVKLATALVHDPPLLILDEPTSGLDPAGRQEMLDLIDDLVRNKGKSVILSSHILSDVERVCGSAVLLEQGRLRAAGSLEELTRFSEPVFLLRLLEPVEGLAAHLASAGLRAQAVDSETMEVVLPAQSSPAALFAGVRAAGGVVYSLLKKRRTLEEVFVTAVGAARNA